MIIWIKNIPAPNFGGKFTSSENRIESLSKIAHEERIVDFNYRSKFNATFIFTEKQFALFKGFYEYDLHDGIDFFKVDWLHLKAVCRFSTNYNAQRNNDGWTITVELEIDNALENIPFDISPARKQNV
ncbi:hypothetical protein JK628_03020 [Shewanella sp. KX20019]|uniref:hypothetical protein n=1 Tax=Shewanella sp. KX20019 TaxID=2803864 RepID=UPI0019287EDC|nr:hypothetical protein [Shewanella sp. KX20019]QQX80862.1 hypothetical protein JK628_03020 [Shewanella sp. KX20019]